MATCCCGFFLHVTSQEPSVSQLLGQQRDVLFLELYLNEVSVSVSGALFVISSPMLVTSAFFFMLLQVIPVMCDAQEDF